MFLPLVPAKGKFNSYFFPNVKVHYRIKKSAIDYSVYIKIRQKRACKIFY